MHLKQLIIIYNHIMDTRKMGTSIDDLRDDTEYEESGDDDVVQRQAKKTIKQIKNIKRDKSSKTESIKDIGRDAILLYILYIIFSTQICRNFIGKYVSIVRPNGDGEYTIVASLVYGFILVALYTILKMALMYITYYIRKSCEK